MALHAVDRSTPIEIGAHEDIDVCPVCAGRMETVYSRAHQKVSVCVECRTSVMVPASAWRVKAEKER